MNTSSLNNFYQILQYFIVLSSVIYICFHLSQQNNKAVIIYIATLIILRTFKTPIFISFFLAMLIAYLCFDFYYLSESFTEKEKKKLSKFNISKTVSDAMANLTPAQIENMAQETQSLVQTQQKLVETLKQLTPIVKNGMELMSNFGDSKDGGILELFQKMKNKENKTTK
jgi:K+-sensing histidine kinase KdpD